MPNLGNQNASSNGMPILFIVQENELTVSNKELAIKLEASEEKLSALRDTNTEYGWWNGT